MFRQPDCDRWRRSGQVGPLAGNSCHGSLAESARGFGLREAVCDKILIFRPPFGLLCLTLKRRLFLKHSRSLELYKLDVKNGQREITMSQRRKKSGARPIHVMVTRLGDQLYRIEPKFGG